MRERHEPVRLFGETDRDSYERLRSLELELTEHEGVRGMRNDLLQAFEQVDEEQLLEMMQSQGRLDVPVKSLPLDSSLHQHDWSLMLAQLKSTHAPHEAESALNSESPPTDTATAQTEGARGASAVGAHGPVDVVEIILHYWRHLLALWAQELNARAVDTKASYSGRWEAARHRQTSEYIKPLFKKLKSRVSLLFFAFCLVQSCRCTYKVQCTSKFICTLY